LVAFALSSFAFHLSTSRRPSSPGAAAASRILPSRDLLLLRLLLFPCFEADVDELRDWD
jgi:hypothetical protein